MKGSKTTVVIPDWFDKSLENDLVEKVNRKRGPLSFVDSMCFSVLEWFKKHESWRFQKWYDWQELEAIMSEDCQTIQQNNFTPDAIIGIKSGGAFIARFLAERLGVPTKEVHYINVNRYTPVFGSTVVAFLYVYHGSAKLSVEHSIDLTGKTVLLVDDQIMTGKTLQVAKSWAENQGASSVKTYCLFSQKVKTDFGSRSGMMMKSPWGDDP